MKTERNFPSISVKALFFALVLVACLSVQLVAHADSLPVGSIASANVDTKLNMRAQPQGEIIGGIPKGDTVTILSQIDRNGYYRVRVNKTNVECYVYGEYLKLLRIPTDITVRPQPEVVETVPSVEIDPNVDTTQFLPVSQLKGADLRNARLVVTSEKQLNLRKRSSKQGNRIMYLEYGDILQVVSPEIKNGYILVRDLTSKKVGYVDTDFVVFEAAYIKHISTLGTTSVPVDSSALCPACGCKYQCNCPCH